MITLSIDIYNYNEVGLLKIDFKSNGGELLLINNTTVKSH